jgi:hypothetical protein
VIDDERILVFGRVRAWDQRGFVDIASAWAFAIRDGKVVSIQVFGNPGEAHGAFRD